MIDQKDLFEKFMNLNLRDKKNERFLDFFLIYNRILILEKGLK